MYIIYITCNMYTFKYIFHVHIILSIHMYLYTYVFHLRLTIYFYEPGLVLIFEHTNGTQPPAASTLIVLIFPKKIVIVTSI